jgi:hypothetical protein
MPLRGYEFSIAGDTPHGRVDLQRLEMDIHLSAITIAYDHASTNGDVLTCWFKDELVGNNYAALSVVIHSHSGDPLEGDPQPVILTAASLTVPTVQKGFPDYSGYPYFGDSLIGTAIAGQTTVFYIAFDKPVRIQGGGFRVGGGCAFGDYMIADMTYLQTPYVVGQFINKMHVWGGRVWEKATPDCQLVPVGIYLRMRYVSVAPVGSPSVNIWGWYDMRRVPNA